MHSVQLRPRCVKLLHPPRFSSSAAKMEFENEIRVKEYCSIIGNMLMTCTSLALSLTLWVVSLTISTYYSTLQPVSPWRWLFSVLVPMSLASRAQRSGSLNQSGALGGMLVGSILIMANKSFFFSMLVYYVTSSRLLQWVGKMKQGRDLANQAEAPVIRIGWTYLLFNAGIPTELALLYIIETGPRELPVDFQRNYGATWLCLSLLGALACRTGDAWASKLGPALSKSSPRLITTWRTVPAGTNGGVTPEGFAASFVGGAVVGVAYFMAQLLFVSDLHQGAPQWPIVLYAGLAGLLGSLLDSLLGAETQYSGYDERTKKVVNYESSTTKRICGKPILDNNSVDLFSSIIIALTLPDIAWGVWPQH